MTNPSPEVKDVFSIFSFISERGVISGLYLSSLVFGIIIGNPKLTLATDLYVWVFGNCVLMGLIVSNITFELLVPLYQWLTSPMVLSGFYSIVKGDMQKHIENYNDLRKVRENLLAAEDQSHFKMRLFKDERLRHTTTYLSTSSLFALSMLLIAYYGFHLNEFIVKMEFLIVIYILISSSIGLVVRSKTLGRTIGLAYISQKTDPKPVNNKEKSKS